MNNSGDAAEQVIRLSLEGFEVAARLSGTAAKEVAVLLAAALKSNPKTKGKARLSAMIRSGKPLKVFSLPQKEVAQFCKQAKRYGVLYCVLRDKSTNDPNAVVDIIAREEDASKIQRVIERFDLNGMDKASVIANVEQQRNAPPNPTREAPKSEPLSGKDSDRSTGIPEQRESVRKKLAQFRNQTPVRKPPERNTPVRTLPRKPRSR